MKLKLLGVKEVPDFPSGSGMEYFNNKVYLVGDDAKEILVMDPYWKKLETIPLFESEEFRLSKKEKPDLEATTVAEVNKIPRLMIIGSGSKKVHRDKLILINLDDHTREDMEIAGFYKRLKESLDHLNIESAAVILGKLVLGNRGHKGSPDNTIVVTDMDFWKHQENAEITTVHFDLPEPAKKVAGISGMTYSHLNDWLIATISTEDTDNAVDDGAIGDSYLAIVENASRKISRKKMKVNELINLSEVHEVFKEQKIESVCIQSEKEGKLKLHLVADNDTGSSCVFKVRLKG